MNDDWTKREDDRLRALWAAGTPCSQIGETMRRTKNSVVGRANRLHLPARKSPIKAAGGSRKPRVPRAPRITLTIEAAAALTPEVAPVAMTPSILSAHPRCQWIDGDGRPVVFCDAPAVPGRSWCPVHYAVVFVPRSRVAPVVVP